MSFIFYPSTFSFMDYRPEIKVNWIEPKVQKLRQKIISIESQHTLLHVCSVSAVTLMPTELLRVNYAHVYSNLREHFTLSNHTAEFTLQLCGFVIKHSTWMSWRRRQIVDEWMTANADNEVNVFVCVCVWDRADLVWFHLLFCRWERRATTPRRWWRWRGRWLNTWSSFSRSPSSVASPTAAESTRGQRKDVWGGRKGETITHSHTKTESMLSNTHT